MRIGELSTRTGIAASRIRFYEKHALLVPPVRTENGYREYPESAVKALMLIDKGQQLGFSLKEIREALGEAPSGLPTVDVAVRALHGKLASIDRHLKEVRARRRQIVDLLKELEEGHSPPSTPFSRPLLPSRAG